MEFIKEPNILLSVINTKLRDEYDSLDALADDLDWSIEEINMILKIDFMIQEIRNKNPVYNKKIDFDKSIK